MARRGRPTVEINLTPEERATLERWVRRHRSSQALALRCRIVLACADGLTHAEIATRLGCNPVTVGKWRRRFGTDRLDGHPLACAAPVCLSVLGTFPRFGAGRRPGLSSNRRACR
jgi:DNA-binding CsgD family transcriptional regulator